MMKKLLRKRIILFFLILPLMLSGCRIGNKDVVVSGTFGEKQLFKIGNMSCSLKEAKVYLLNYQNIYGTAYGLNLWEHDFGDSSLTDYVKNITMQELTQVVCLNELAKSKELALTADEEEKTVQAAKEYYESLTEDEIAYLDVSEDDIAGYYGHYALAQKLYHSLIAAVDEEVSDDEARVIEIMQIFVSDEAKAAEVGQKLAAGEDFASVAGSYNELSDIQVTVSRDDLPEEVASVAFELDNDEVSGEIASDGGYYFIRCVNKYNEELTDANKANIVEKRKKEAFDDEYNAFVESLDSVMDETLWEELAPDTASGMTTDTFFEIYEKNCGDI